MKRTLALVAAAVVSACGGSSSSSAPATPSQPNPGEPNGTFETATAITLGTPVVATMSAGRNPNTMIDGDKDIYKFEVPAGGATVRFQTFDRDGTQCDPANEGVDPLVEVYDANHQLLGMDDDGGLAPWCEDLTLTLPAGTNYVLVSGWDPTAFEYTLKASIVP